MSAKLTAFMSYAPRDDDDKALTELRKHLIQAVRMQTGSELEIFHDRLDIEWGQAWREHIEESLDELTFMIPIITPSFLKSQQCRDKVRQFLDREKVLGRNDLILPI
jgi:cobaltochelatase CobT